MGVVNHGLIISFITLTCTDGQQLNKQYCFSCFGWNFNAIAAAAAAAAAEEEEGGDGGCCCCWRRREGGGGFFECNYD